MIEHDRSRKAILAVADGLGFVIEAGGQRLVITAYHCLPHPPMCRYRATAADRCYADLLGRDGEKPEIAAACVFADPVADLAVLAAPDARAMPAARDDYGVLVGAAVPLRIGALGDGLRDRARTAFRCWLPTLDGRWVACTVTPGDVGLWFANATERVRGGSGGPIVTADGTAVGVLCTASSAAGFTSGGPNPALAAHLPGWILRGALPG